ncbi:type II toxin-antitoxin system HicA family toxin [Picosynechococcus sp. PCC 73109]|uniref:type II toxin-antitoxin system HicA family toxin n=1 Tax=Picosynechococcus sp. PCC 73109 TaxID=374982 RepID=UPI0007457F5A|nr:type II toxin-antitoxin system HicA family toxin [Picosynechococcus sp. PCC 73109]AMA10679.1 hypothetical protein AWQ23_14635 [Picosynechococcus sp. PCC 73109]
MKSISGKKLCKVLNNLGWQLKRIKGSHHIYSNSETHKILVIPVHGNKDLPAGTLKNILRDANLTEADLP